MIHIDNYLYLICENAIDINMCLAFISKMDCNSSMIDYRFKRKLIKFKDMYEGAKIDGIELRLDCIPKNMEFNIFTVLTSLIDIEAMKNVRNKLDEIDADNYDDLHFTESLYTEFNSVLFSQVYDNDLTEAVVLSCNMDMEKIPSIDISILGRKINKLYGVNSDDYFGPLNATFVELAKISVDRLLEVDDKKNSKNVFKNLIFISRLEVLISYMDRNTLEKLLKYCEMFLHKNNFGINNIMKLIKDKFK